MKLVEEKNTASSIMEALKTGDETKVEQAVKELHESLSAKLLEDFNDVVKQNDKSILTQRGYRNLTSEETAFYEKFIESAKSANPKQALADLLTVDGGMPETIYEDIYRDLRTEHPLLSRINFVNVKYLTKWLLNDHTADRFAWGEINSEITKELTSSFKSINVVQGKLSAFVLIALDMLELGPVFLDAYIRAFIKEAEAAGLEYGIVKGIGVKGEPIGLIRDIHEGVTVNTTTGYPAKTAIPVVSFAVKDYCNLIATNLLKKENNKVRVLTKVSLLVNPIDYIKKIIPATTTKAPDGTYRNDLFPFPTEVIQTTALNEGEAILAILPEYFFGIGAGKTSQIEYSDEYKFLEDVRTYKAKMFGFGRAEDNTSAALLDISNLDENYVTVNVNEVKGTVKTKEQA